MNAVDAKTSHILRQICGGSVTVAREVVARSD